MQRVEEFIRSARDVAGSILDRVKSGSNLLVVGHNDADGLSSLGVAGGVLRELDAYFVLRCVRKIDDFLSGYVDGEFDLVVMLDMGSGYLNELYDRVSKSRLIILDHHYPLHLKQRPNWEHYNPHLFEIDGSVEISASGVTYLVFKNLLEEYYKFAPVAIVGALGDLQDRGNRKLRGLNRMILEEGIKTEVIKVAETLVLNGRTFRPIHLALASTYNPFLPSLSGNEGACLSVVTSAGIELRDGDVWRTVADLSDDEVRALYNSIIAHMVENGYSSNIASELYGEIYEFTNEEEGSSLRDGREFATLLNACGKGDHAWLGIAIAMGERGRLLDKAHKVLENYRSALAKVMEKILRPGMLEHMYNIVVLRGGDMIDPKQVSSIATLLSSSHSLPLDKPLIAFAYDGDQVKVSARASSELVEGGLDLGAIMSLSAAKYGGRGGGHKVAAGAEVQADRLTLFLLEVDRLVGESIKERRKTPEATLEGG
ncbi:MAG: DHH family phosphoesterase [Aigarchaeota archaeon]|nr:DHH family phosphoesterase [Aigarchaeota archaeon]MDW8092451.1 DHH family phosphoesterase [Nitrososphaerota archaeon]